MGKILRGFRSKMIILLGLSMFLSSVITYLLFRVLQIYYYTNVNYGDTLAYFRKIIQNIGDLNVFLLVFITLSILFFFLLTKPYSAYFNEISKGIHYLAQGDFKHRVQILSNDEFSDI